MPALLGAFGMVGAIVCIALLIVKTFRKQLKLNAWVILTMFIVCLACFVVAVAITPSPNENSETSQIAENTQAPDETTGGFLNGFDDGYQATIAEPENSEVVTQREESSSEPPQTSEPELQSSDSLVDTSVTFADIYRDRKANELVSDEKYNGNRYRITAEINGMETDGLFNLTGGATLTMETRVDNTIVFFYAEFEKEQEDALKLVVVGDTISFEGVCWGGSFSKCEIVE